MLQGKCWNKDVVQAFQPFKSILNSFFKIGINVELVCQSSNMISENFLLSDFITAYEHTLCHRRRIMFELVMLDSYHQRQLCVVNISPNGCAFMIGTKITAAVARRDGTARYTGKGYSEESFQILKSILSPSPGLLAISFTF